MFYAHTTADRTKADWQPLNDHLLGVAGLAAEFAAGFGGSNAAQLAGLLHDLGKYAPAFQRYLEGRGPSIDHSTAGARQAATLTLERFDRLVAELIAYAVAGHHAGLPDKTGETASLTGRLQKTGAPLDPVWRDEIPFKAADLLPQRFAWHEQRERYAFQLGFLGRMLFSCLVDADFLDTEAFYAKQEGRPVDRDWPRLPDIVERLTGAFDTYMAAKQAGAEPSALNRLRGAIFDHVRAKAALAPGLFTLDVPTGGGKTLASLGFALDHARRHGLQRIVYAIPFTSVIDQTAAVFRDVLGEGVVLEHHSAIDEDKMPRDGRAGRDKLRLATENWAAPVVVTTNVQLFESLFAARPSRCRKLHNLAESVIVLDEAQTIPLHVLKPCVAALDELARNYGSSVVLCTATQPALAAPRFVGGLTLPPERELAPDPEGLHDRLRRVGLRIEPQPMTDAALVAALSRHEQGLVIVNSRVHALRLYRAAQAEGLEGLVHLTTRQTATDRREILAAVRARLDATDPRPCRLIATSLIEAGVDIDFPRVWRAEAGLDQIIQAAGRCNREGRRKVDDSIVTVFRPADAKTPSEIAGFAAATRRTIAHHSDLLTPTAIERYFQEVYWQKGEELDRDKVVECFKISAGATDFPYRSVSEKFRLIESGMAPVIIAIEDEPRAALGALRSGQTPSVVARRLQPYLVQVPPNERDRLIANGHVAFEGFGDQFAVLKTDRFYSRDIGLEWERADELGVDDNII